MAFHNRGMHRTTGRKLFDAGEFEVKIDDHVFRSQHPDPANLSLHVTPLKRPGPEIHVFLLDGFATAYNVSCGIDKFGIGPVILAVGRSVGMVPGINKAIQHGFRRGPGRVISRAGIVQFLC